VLLFWYRNQIYAIAARSPAEGAYSEGFIKAKFTQDYGIICPQTGSVFSLKDGSVAEWYPSNPVLRSITPIPDPLPVRSPCFLSLWIHHRIEPFSLPFSVSFSAYRKSQGCSGISQSNQ
jgi:nitrite reductase/ring-hydroxylating ferredoxin subunit